MVISVLSKGAISIEDTNNMPCSDRQRIFNILTEAEKHKQEQLAAMG